MASILQKFSTFVISSVNNSVPLITSSESSVGRVSSLMGKSNQL